MNGTIEIGFSQRVRLEWLEHTADLVLAGRQRGDIKSSLEEMLRDQLSVGSNPERGNRDKAVTILLRSWVSVPKSLEPLRNDALALLQRLPSEERLAVHWGMAMAAYPFFGAVAETAGRLLRLQGSVAAPQVQRRIREQLGERETVARAARRVLRSFVDWGVLRDTEVKGRYEGVATRPVRDRVLARWLVEATLLAGGTGTGVLAGLVGSPALFPFDLQVHTAMELDRSPRLEFLRQGLDQEVVILRRAITSAPRSTS